MMRKERQLKKEIHEQKVQFESRLNGFKRELDWQRNRNCALEDTATFVALRVLSNCAVAKAKKEFSDPAANGTKANFLQTTSLLSRSTKIYFKKAYENSPSLGSCFTEASHVVRVPRQ
ncbi:hypothetical protein FN846DRAFT_902877 [Sphaerosporella brunnea]|uniref:Uncharacterized protein n=1 Tax=Sphaerosporella brunnea TaxID=1250544 RepID=A0A5J5F850_9PEZI|nr:hypothetical protein FN846DRAFT_902877 [Sphaerosporella brunnea]